MTHRMRRNALLLSASILAAGLSGYSGSAVAADQTYQFDIPAESLGQALTDFSRVFSQQIVFSEDAVNGKKISGLHGRYSASDALNTLIAGTGLQIETNSSGVMMVRPKNAQAASNEAASQSGAIETVTVTGTHIRDVEPLTPTQTITSADIVNQGYSTLTDAMQALPANSKASVSADRIGPDSGNNYSYASGINLYGLGTNDTLVLLNGRRMAPTAQGYTTDISGIPVSALDRVEILDDGASAIYGADAVAGVVNIITKTNYEGIETGLKAFNMANGKQPDYEGYILGGDDWDSGNIILDYNYTKQNPQLASSRSYTSTAPSPYYLLPQQEASSFYGSANQDITSQLRFSADALYASRSYVSTQNVGFTSDSAGRDKQFSGSAELDYSPFSDWKFSLVGSLGTESDPYVNNYPDFDQSEKSTTATRTTRSTLWARAACYLFQEAM